jgi:hypothetical protein
MKYAVLPQLPLEIFIIEWESVDKPMPGEVEVKTGVVSGKPKEVETEPVKVTPVKTSSAPKVSDSFTLDFITEIKSHNHLLAGVLRSCEIDNSKEGVLQILAISKFHKDKLEEEKSMIILQEAVEKLTGKKHTVSIILRG